METSKRRRTSNGISLIVTVGVLIGSAVFLGDQARRHRVTQDEVQSAIETDALSESPPGSDSQLPALPAVEEVIGASVLGQPVERVALGDGPVTVLFLASIHGSESAGTPLLLRLVRRLKATPELLHNRTVVVLPMVNPDGVAADARYNARGIDLNRNFPAENRQNTKRFGLEALSEPEAVAVFRTIDDFMPSHIVTLHEPLNCVDYDGPAKGLAQVMSDVCPLQVKKLGSRPGSLGSYAGVTLGIPTVTFELPRNARDLNDDQLWALYGNALLAAVSWTPAVEITHVRLEVP